MATIMQRLAKWHIWLGWLVGVPIVMWVATGLFMVSRPIDEVRGSHLQIAQEQQPLIIEGSEIATADMQLGEMQLVMQDGRAVAILTTLDGQTRRVDFASGQPIPALDAEAARALVERRIVGGDAVQSVTFFNADKVPFDFRRPIPVWQVGLSDGTHVYVGRDSGQIEAVRTRWWRWFDFMWGLHIMDISEREDTSHPILILFATLALIGSLFGLVLMFRRRKSRVKPSS
ncbi:hypothetical protein FGU71_11020 [Erythrobacter insulae]|uniref:PepSY domain-containing protein n=1 Tax=Erythrobacter insulae TaxID=2584124 RepID=A0A547PE64_9SPHN|nr:PepSY domain-containing protein [Erythrobacter insulae]TRD12344.1 hypothetical protein FGU71_11020 [Erythrobacter insulae]